MEAWSRRQREEKWGLNGTGMAEGWWRRGREPVSVSHGNAGFPTVSLPWDLWAIPVLSSKSSLLIKPGGMGFYYLQPSMPRLKQMRVYFQIIGPKRQETSMQPTYLWKTQRFTCSFLERCPICLWKIEHYKLKRGNLLQKPKTPLSTQFRAGSSLTQWPIFNYICHL